MTMKNKKKGRRPKLNKEKDLEKDEATTEETTESTENTETDKQTQQAAENKADEKKEEISEEDKLKAELADSKDKYLRLMAEYDNFRKRSAKERLEVTDTAKGNTISELLPVFDNFERAMATDTEDKVYQQGVEMIFKQFGDALKKLGVEIIDPMGETFDPNVANAVNQIEDENLGENVVAQVFQKGYKIGDKVIRYAMVVVANP